MIRKIRRALHIRDAHVAWIVSLLLQAPSTGPAFGQSDMGSALGSICVSQLPGECLTVAGIELVPWFEVITYYVVADIDFADAGVPEQNALNGIQAWEARIELPPQLFLVGAEFEGTNGGTSDTDYLVDVGLPALLANSMPRPLVTLRVFATPDLLPGTSIKLLPSTNPLAIGVVGWREALDSNGCTNSETGAAAACFRPFALVEPLDFVRFGSAEAESWTSVKQMFR
jgi:hypothetical protein